MNQSDLPEAFRRLRAAATDWTMPIVADLARRGASPYELLLASVLGSRTLDTLTAVVAPRLFASANTPEKMMNLDAATIARTIREVMFAETKAKQIRALSQLLIDKHNGRVPDTVEELDELPGVGRKIANLVVTQAFGKAGICVDTHVHRIVNRWGYVRTKNPDETELALRDNLPREYWIEINPLLVALGQNICHANLPRCTLCPEREFCERVGVSKSR